MTNDERRMTNASSSPSATATATRTPSSFVIVDRLREPRPGIRRGAGHEIAAAAAAGDVVRVHVGPCGNVRGRGPDRAAVLDDRVARGNRPQRDLVARRDGLEDGDDAG